jgi:hypothetical protein
VSAARIQVLRDAVTTRGGRWTTRRAWALYRTHNVPQRGTARRDLRTLAREGVLTERGPGDGRYYQLKDTTA